MKKLLIAAAAFVCALVLASCGHSHEFSDKWSTDGTHHWKACTGDCTEVASRAEHDWGEPEVIEPTEEAEGSRTYTCKVCGAEKIEKIEKLPAHECYFSADWVSDADSHWHPCTAKEGCVKKGTPTAHVWGEPTVTKKPTVDAEGEKQSICTECGRTKTEKMAKLPPKMSEADWKALFIFDNLKVTGEMTMGDFGSSNVVYLIDGDRVHEIVDGVTSAVGREILVEMDFANYYSSFDNMGNGLYVAEEIVIEDETYGGMKLQDVQVSIKERVTKVEYGMDVLGLTCHIVYEFSDYGNVKIESSMTREEWEAAFALENVRIDGSFRIMVNGAVQQANQFTYYVDGDTVLIEDDGVMTETGREVLYDLALGDYFDAFTETAPGVFEAATLKIYYDETTYDVFNDVVIAMDAEGRPASVSYLVTVEGDQIGIIYTFDGWGEIDIK